MASTTIQGQHGRIRKVIRKTTWAMLFIGIMVTAAGFAIQGEYSSVYWRTCDVTITVAVTYGQYWCGFMVCAFHFFFIVLFFTTSHVHTSDRLI